MNFYNKLNHSIVEQSFAIIDSEVGEHNLDPQEYAIARRVIHATADFDYLKLLRFSPGAIDSGIARLKQGTPIVTDVTMVKQGIRNLVAKTFNNPIISAIEQAQTAEPGKTRTETGLLRCWEKISPGYLCHWQCTYCTFGTLSAAIGLYSYTRIGYRCSCWLCFCD